MEVGRTGTFSLILDKLKNSLQSLTRLRWTLLRRGGRAATNIAPNLTFKC